MSTYKEIDFANLVVSHSKNTMYIISYAYLKIHSKKSKKRKYIHSETIYSNDIHSLMSKRHGFVLFFYFFSTEGGGGEHFRTFRLVTNSNKR